MTHVGQPRSAPEVVELSDAGHVLRRSDEALASADALEFLSADFPRPSRVLIGRPQTTVGQDLALGKVLSAVVRQEPEAG